jgi:hypothetical protein
MTANANASVTRNQRIHLLRKIRDLKSLATRARVAGAVLGHCWHANEFDSLLSDELLHNAIVVVVRRRKNRRAGHPLKGCRWRAHRKFKRGRPALLFKLTRTGHALLRRLMKQRDADRAAVAQARELARQQRAQAATARTEAKAKRDALAAQELRQAQDEEAAARATRQAIEADRHKRAGGRAGPRTPAQVAQFEEARASQASIRARRKEAEAEPDVLREPERVESGTDA